MYTHSQWFISVSHYSSEDSLSYAQPRCYYGTTLKTNPYSASDLIRFHPSSLIPHTSVNVQCIGSNGNINLAEKRHVSTENYIKD